MHIPPVGATTPVTRLHLIRDMTIDNGVVTVDVEPLDVGADIPVKDRMLFLRSTDGRTRDGEPYTLWEAVQLRIDPTAEHGSRMREIHTVRLGPGQDPLPTLVRHILMWVVANADPAR
ncbi:hypothetical protein OG216_34860 [Streptomycetaceae bacterium NBC_01309]